MKNLFIPYELALLAREKGFDEPCLAYNSIENGFVIGLSKPITDDKNGCTSIPLYQQVIDWLYGKGISLELYSCDAGSNFNHVIRKVGRNLYEIKALDNKNVPDRYEALNKGIEEAFKLIKSN